jgi:hypothetical protein
MVGGQLPWGNPETRFPDFIAVQSAPPQSAGSIFKAVEQNARLGAEPHLPNSEMSAGTVTREEIDAKIAASEARNDTKFARLEGQMAQMLQKLDTIHEDNRSVKTNVWAGVGLIVAVIALLTGVTFALAPAAFTAGLDIQDKIEQSVRSVTSPPKTP